MGAGTVLSAGVVRPFGGGTRVEVSGASISDHGASLLSFMSQQHTY
jgi:hypothetical protein